MPLVQLTDLCKIYSAGDNEVRALGGVSLSIEAGEFVAITGQSGSGKSTLLRILAGVYEANGGTVRIDGRPSFDDQDVKSRVYFISDYPYFFNDSTVETPPRSTGGCTLRGTNSNTSSFAASSPSAQRPKLSTCQRACSGRPP